MTAPVHARLTIDVDDTRASLALRATHAAADVVGGAAGDRQTRAHDFPPPYADSGNGPSVNQAACGCSRPGVRTQTTHVFQPIRSSRPTGECSTIGSGVLSWSSASEPQSNDCAMDSVSNNMLPAGRTLTITVSLRVCVVLEPDGVVRRSSSASVVESV